MWLKSKKTFDFYLGGPMRGYKNSNKPMFFLVAKLLREMGFTVWSPAEHESASESSFSQVMIVDLNKVVNQCHKIALLPGWRKSLGANMEAFSAFACGKEAVEVVFREDKIDFDLVPLDLSKYRLPYWIGETSQFNPHLHSLS